VPRWPRVDVIIITRVLPFTTVIIISLLCFVFRCLRIWAWQYNVLTAVNFRLLLIYLCECIMIKVISHIMCPIILPSCVRLAFSFGIFLSEHRLIVERWLLRRCAIILYTYFIIRRWNIIILIPFLTNWILFSLTFVALGNTTTNKSRYYADYKI